MNFSKTIIIDPVWNEIENARKQIFQFLKEKSIAENHIHAATMILSELIENGVKYGKFLPTDQLEARINLEADLITIEVTHPVAANNSLHLRELDEMIQWIRGYQDPFEAYIEKLKRIAKMPLEDKKSGLGLVRIAYEGGAILDFFIDENENLNVSAVLKY